MGAARSKAGASQVDEEVESANFRRRDLFRRQLVEIERFAKSDSHLHIHFDGPKGAGKTSIVWQLLLRSGDVDEIEPTTRNEEDGSSSTLSGPIESLEFPFPPEGLNLKGVEVSDTSDYYYVNSQGSGGHFREHEYSRFAKAYPWDFHLAILVFDLSSRESFEGLKEIMKQWRFPGEKRFHSEDAMFVAGVMGNKSELDPAVPKEEILEAIKELGNIPYLENSVKEGKSMATVSTIVGFTYDLIATSQPRHKKK